MLFEPSLLTTIWGGRKLKPYKGLEPTDEPIGESWEVSAIPSSVSIISNGIWKGRDLNYLIEEFPNEILGKKVNDKYQGKLPLLVKFLDANRDLSIQVHPDEEMAQRLYGKRGKAEMWYVIDADADSHLFVGFNREISLEEYHRRIAEGTITEVLADHKVKPGDVFFIPAGCVHALCGGIMVAEVQQSSDVTYRIYDYNRRDADGNLRQLHTEEAMDAIDFSGIQNHASTRYQTQQNGTTTLAACPYFITNLLSIDQPIRKNLEDFDTFVVYMCIDGIAAVKSMDTIVPLHAGECVLVPAMAERVELFSEGPAKLLEVYIDTTDWNDQPSNENVWIAQFIAK